MNDKKIYAIDMTFSQMRFLDDNSAINTSLYTNYTLMGIKKGELKEVLPDIRKELQNILNKYAEKYPFTDDK